MSSFLEFSPVICDMCWYTPMKDILTAEYKSVDNPIRMDSHMAC